MAAKKPISAKRFVSDHKWEESEEELIGVICWDYCDKCKEKKNKWMVSTKHMFDAQRAEAMEFTCATCYGPLVSYNEIDNPI